MKTPRCSDSRINFCREGFKLLLRIFLLLFNDITLEGCDGFGLNGQLTASILIDWWVNTFSELAFLFLLLLFRLSFFIEPLTRFEWRFFYFEFWLMRFLLWFFLWEFYQRRFNIFFGFLFWSLVHFLPPCESWPIEPSRYWFDSRWVISFV